MELLIKLKLHQNLLNKLLKKLYKNSFDLKIKIILCIQSLKKYKYKVTIVLSNNHYICKLGFLYFN